MQTEFYQMILFCAEEDFNPAGMKTITSSWLICIYECVRKQAQSHNKMYKIQTNKILN